MILTLRVSSIERLFGDKITKKDAENKTNLIFYAI